MPRAGRVDEHVPLGGEGFKARSVSEPRMIFARDADVVDRPEELPANALAQAGERSGREVELAGLERRFETRDVERHDLQTHFWRAFAHRADQRGKLPYRAGIDAREAEGSC